MGLIKFTIDDKTYELEPDKLTLGELSDLKHHFGLESIDRIAFGDPDILIGLMAIGFRRADNELSLEDATSKARGLDIQTVGDAFAVDEPDPTDAGKPATRKTSGSRG